MPAGPRRIRGGREVLGLGVDPPVELRQEDGDRLDPLPADPAGGEVLLGRREVAGPDGVGERAGSCRQGCGLARTYALYERTDAAT
jgi:hypothetical protein